MRSNYLALKKTFTTILALLCAQFVSAQQISVNHETALIKDSIFLSMMDTMMIKMHQINHQQTAGAEFIAQMVPHHWGAIEMANYEILHGKEFAMIQLAKSILVEQTSEIEQMELWLNLASINTGESSPNFLHLMDQSMEIMMKNMPQDSILINIDRAFAAVMIPHHQAAIDMARAVIRYSNNKQVEAFAKHIISSEQVEIEQMKIFVN